MEPVRPACEDVQQVPRRLRILAIAEAANPEWVSVPLVGWSIAHALRRHHDVHLVTQIRNRDAVLRAGLRESVDFTAIDSEAVARPIYKLAELLRMGQGKGWTMVTALSSRLAYPYFERKLWQRFGPDIKAGRYDIVYRITPLTPTANSSLAQKCARAGVHFVMGPLNGGVPWPKGFDAERRREREWLSYVRGAYRLSRGRHKMLKSCTAVIAGSRYTASELPEWMQNRVSLIPENGIDPKRFSAQMPINQPSGPCDTPPPLRGCFLGRLVPYKGPDMLIEAAAAHLRDGRLVLDIVGDGPMAEELHILAESLGVLSAITFHGWVEHDRVQEILGKAQLLTFPSIREFGGGVVLEAMALGVVPVICDYAGPGELVDDSTGFKIPVGTRSEVITAYRGMLDQIIADPGVLPAMSKAALRRVEEYFTWDRKARQIGSVLEWTLDPQSSIPQPVPLAGHSTRHEPEKRTTDG